MGSIEDMQALLTVMEQQSIEIRQSRELDASIEENYGDDGFEDFIEDDDDVENEEAYDAFEVAAATATWDANDCGIRSLAPRVVARASSASSRLRPVSGRRARPKSAHTPIHPNPPGSQPLSCRHRMQVASTTRARLQAGSELARPRSAGYTRQGGWCAQGLVHGDNMTMGKASSSPPYEDYQLETGPMPGEEPLIHYDLRPGFTRSHAYTPVDYQPSRATPRPSSASSSSSFAASSRPSSATSSRHRAASSSPRQRPVSASSSRCHDARSTPGRRPSSARAHPPPSLATFFHPPSSKVPPAKRPTSARAASSKRYQGTAPSARPASAGPTTNPHGLSANNSNQSQRACGRYQAEAPSIGLRVVLGEGERAAAAQAAPQDVPQRPPSAAKTRPPSAGQSARSSSAHRASRRLAPSLAEVDQLIRQRGRTPMPHLRSTFAREAVAASLPRHTSCVNAMSLNADHGRGGAGGDAGETTQSPTVAPLEGYDIVPCGQSVSARMEGCYVPAGNHQEDPHLHEQVDSASTLSAPCVSSNGHTAVVGFCSTHAANTSDAQGGSDGANSELPCCETVCADPPSASPDASASVACSRAGSPNSTTQCALNCEGLGKNDEEAAKQLEHEGLQIAGGDVNMDEDCNDKDGVALECYQQVAGGRGGAPARGKREEWRGMLEVEVLRVRDLQSELCHVTGLAARKQAKLQELRTCFTKLCAEAPCTRALINPHPRLTDRKVDPALQAKLAECEAMELQQAGEEVQGRTLEVLAERERGLHQSSVRRLAESKEAVAKHQLDRDVLGRRSIQAEHEAKELDSKLVEFRKLLESRKQARVESLDTVRESHAAAVNTLRYREARELRAEVLADSAAASYVWSNMDPVTKNVVKGIVHAALSRQQGDQPSEEQQVTRASCDSQAPTKQEQLVLFSEFRRMTSTFGATTPKGIVAKLNKTLKKVEETKRKVVSLQGHLSQLKNQQANLRAAEKDLERSQLQHDIPKIYVKTEGGLSEKDLERKMDEAKQQMVCAEGKLLSENRIITTIRRTVGCILQRISECAPALSAPANLDLGSDTWEMDALDTLTTFLMHFINPYLPRLMSECLTEDQAAELRQEMHAALTTALTDTDCSARKSDPMLKRRSTAFFQTKPSATNAATKHHSTPVPPPWTPAGVSQKGPTSRSKTTTPTKKVPTPTPVCVRPKIDPELLPVAIALNALFGPPSFPLHRSETTDMKLPEYNDRLSHKEFSNHPANIFLPQQPDTEAAMPYEPTNQEANSLAASHPCKSSKHQNPLPTHGPHPELTGHSPGVLLNGNHVPTAEQLIQLSMKDIKEIIIQGVEESGWHQEFTPSREGLKTLGAHVIDTGVRRKYQRETKTLSEIVAKRI